MIPYIVFIILVLTIYKIWFYYHIKSQYSIDRIRDLSLQWWDSLSVEEATLIEMDYFDDLGIGETTDIDIEAMYREYIHKM